MTRAKGYVGYTTKLKGQTRLFYDGVSKQCSKCNCIRPVDQFNKNSQTHYGINSICKICEREKARERYQEKPKVFGPPMRELGNGRKESYKNWRQKKLDEGICTYCGKAPRWEKRTRCKDCVLRRRQLYYDKRGVRIEAGLCKQCGLYPIFKAEKCDVCWNKLSHRDKRKRTSLRERVLEKLGRFCACCGETINQFLTVDHINNDGYLDRRTEKRGNTKSLFRKILSGERTDLQILCWNCNLGKNVNGGVCPHIKGAETTWIQSTN